MWQPMTCSVPVSMFPKLTGKQQTKREWGRGRTGGWFVLAKVQRPHQHHNPQKAGLP